MAIKEYTPLSLSPELEPQFQVQFSVIPEQTPFLGG